MQSRVRSIRCRAGFVREGSAGGGHGVQWLLGGGGSRVGVDVDLSEAWIRARLHSGGWCGCRLQGRVWPQRVGGGCEDGCGLRWVQCKGV